jgi:hypothetical protein
MARLRRQWGVQFRGHPGEGWGLAVYSTTSRDMADRNVAHAPEHRRVVSRVVSDWEPVK